MSDFVVNQSPQPTPEARFVCISAPLVRRGCGARWMNSMRRGLWFTAAVFLLGFLPRALAWEPRRAATSAAEMLVEIQKVYPAVCSIHRTNMVTSKISGRFVRGSGGLAGSNLYLFSDKAYLYTEWSDVLRETIFDRGSWDVTNGFVYLTSDKSLPARFGPRDHVYLPVGLSGSNDLFLMSHRWDFSRFMENAGDNPVFMFLHCVLCRSETLSGKTERRMKARLLRKALRKPEFYQ